MGGLSKEVRKERIPYPIRKKEKLMDEDDDRGVTKGGSKDSKLKL